MKKSSYHVQPRARLKFLFFGGGVVYDLVEIYDEWYDPSWGNGCGDYRKVTRTIQTFKYSTDATSFRDKLNRIQKENQDACD